MFLLPLISAFAEKGRDPFVSYLPKEEEVQTDVVIEDEGEAEDIARVVAGIHVQGILWGSNDPMAIVDGEVLRVGDSLPDLDAKVHKIEGNTVYILYEGLIHKKNVEKKIKEEGE